MSAGQNAGAVGGHRHRLRGVATAAAEEGILSPKDPEQGVVTAVDNGSIVGQAGIRQPLPGEFGNVAQHRLVRDVHAGHHQQVKPLHQQMVDRGIGQHDPELPCLAQVFRSVRPLFQQHNGGSGAAQPSLLIRREVAIPSHHGQIPAHEGKGPLVSPFPAAQFGYRLREVSPTGQMIAAQALDRHNAPSLQNFLRPADGVGLLLSRRGEEL